MKLIKRLHLFILQTFLPLFAMTFFIVLFIVLMQFLWKYIDDLVGKGVSFDVLAELFFYAAVSMVPMALPLAILLASLMTFGNLGERLELTAMKASGISLIRVMAPLIVLVGGIAVGAFFFQNDILPKAQVKMWTLLFSMRQKSPELEIPEGVFYDQIPGFDLYVKKKNQNTGMLYDVMIYDISNGGDNATILLADSARLAMTSKMSHLYLHLYQGEQFENLRDQNLGHQNVPFRRESFLDKQVLIPFDANFNRLDEEGMRKQYVGKNIEQLNHTIDSVSVRLDSIGNFYSGQLKSTAIPYNLFTEATSSLNQPIKEDKKPDIKTRSINDLLNEMNPKEASSVLDKALEISMRKQQEMQFRSQEVSDEKRTIRRHEIELIKKFTLSVACIVFFFIGAPLGSIIRKGGIGTPLVISVLFFVFYYVIDNTGYKMARDGRWPVAVGMWLSTCVLLPIGAYVTWKAMNDSSVFDKDRYINWFRRLLGIREKRRVDFKEVIIHDLDIKASISNLEDISQTAYYLEKECRKALGFRNYWRGIVDKTRIRELGELIDSTAEKLTDCRDKNVVVLLKDYPVIRNLLIYSPVCIQNRILNLIASIAGAPAWLIGRRYLKSLISELRQTQTISNRITDILRESGQHDGTRQA